MTGSLGKRLGAVVLVVLVLTVVLLLAAPLLLKGERVRGLVVEQVAAATGGEVALGEASVRVLPRLAVRLAAGRLRGTGADLATRHGSDFGLVSYDAVVDRVDVRVALLPLLRQRIAVESVEIVLDRLEVVRSEDRILAELAILTVDDLQLDLVDTAPPPAGDEPRPTGELIPEDIYCRADLVVGRLTAGEAVYHDVRVEAELDGRLLSTESFSLRRAGGTVTGEAELDWEHDPWGELVFSFDTDGVPASALLEPWAPDLAGRLETVLVGAGSGRCGVRDADTAAATLSLTGEATAGEGVLHAGDWLREVKPYLGQRQDLVDVRFHELDHAFRVEDGRYQVQELVIHGLDTDWMGNGWVGLDGTIDLSLSVKLPPGFTPDLGQWSFLADTLRDEAGRVRLDLRLTGRSERPTVSLDLTQLKEAAADNAEETLKEGLGGLLDKLQNR